MPEPVKIRAVDLVGRLCVASEDGTRLFNKLMPLIGNGQHVVLSFDGVEIVISAFLNAAIGRLYGVLSESVVRERLAVEDIGESDLDLLSRVVENAKRYFANPQQFDRAWKAEVSDEE